MAHFIGDFLLQFDKIHALKYKGIRGLIPHVLIVMACFIIFSWPYLNQLNMWLFILFLFVTHLIQDYVKIEISGDPRFELLFYCLDQVLHILFIAVLFLTDLKHLQPPENEGHNILIALYNNNAVILYGVAVIMASYCGFYFILLYKLYVFNMDCAYHKNEKWYGFIERALITGTFIMGKPWLLLIPIILGLRYLIYPIFKDKLKLSEYFTTALDIILSGLIGTVTGCIFLLPELLL